MTRIEKMAILCDKCIKGGCFTMNAPPLVTMVLGKFSMSWYISHNQNPGDASAVSFILFCRLYVCGLGC